MLLTYGLRHPRQSSIPQQGWSHKSKPFNQTLAQESRLGPVLNGPVQVRAAVKSRTPSQPDNSNLISWRGCTEGLHSQENMCSTLKQFSVSQWVRVRNVGHQIHPSGQPAFSTLSVILSPYKIPPRVIS